MKAITNNLTLIATIVILFIGVFVYKTYFQNSDISLLPTITEQSVGEEIVSLYNTIQSVELDQSIFSSLTYRSLIDFSKPLVPQPTGRQNPFAVLGGQ